MSEPLVDAVAREAQLAVWGFCRDEPAPFFRHVARRVLAVPGLVAVDDVLGALREEAKGEGWMPRGFQLAATFLEERLR